MSDFKSNMSIPEFLNLLDLEQLGMVLKMSREKVENITSQKKVAVWVFSSGMVNEGFYRTEDEAIQAVKDYVISEEYTVHDRVSVYKAFEYAEEAERLFED